MGRLTEANYQSRIIKLDQHLAAATRAYEDAAFKHELDTGSSEEVTQAHGAMADLAQRRQALDAAWIRTKQEIEAERLASDRDARAVVLTKVDTLLADRERAGADMQAAGEAMAAAWCRYQEAGRAALDGLVPYRADFSVSDFNEILRSDFDDPRAALGTAITDAGLQMASNNFMASHFRPSNRSVAEHIAMTNDKLRALISGVAASGSEIV